jgi:2,4-dichlorophenol 6-monooxygenase
MTAPMTDSTNTPLPMSTDVLIVGGGPVGLTLAGLLASAGVSCVVVERRADHIKAPSAHVLRHRPREVLKLLGVDAAIEQAEPALDMHFITWCSTLGGSELGRLDIRGELTSSGKPRERPWTNLSQNRLEPILSAAVAATSGVTLCYSARCESLEQDDESVRAVVSTGGKSHEILASWVVGADGAGSRTRTSVGAELIGHGPLGQFFMVHFRADLSPWIEERPGPIFWLMNPEASGTLIVHDVTSSHVFMTPVNGTDNEEEAIPARLTAALGIDVELEIITIDTWVPFCQVVDEYRHGRVLLLGDAAHRFPPSGGLGLNTGIMEAHNLAWKLALIHHGLANDVLLDSYDSECRPAATTNATDSFDNALRLLQIYEAIGPCNTLLELEQRLSSIDDVERAGLTAAIEAQRSHFLSNGVFPSPADAPAPARWPSRYDGFTIHLTPTINTSQVDAWHTLADIAATELGVAVHVETIEGSCVVEVAAFVTRPDGIVVWNSDQAVDQARDGKQITAAIRSLLHGPSVAS